VITVDDILHHLVARSAAPSTMGAQLDRMRFGLSSQPDPFQARDDAESRMMDQAALLRCMDHFATRQECRGKNAMECKMLARIQRFTRMPQGAIALAVLRAYQEWRTYSDARALVAVYNYVRSIAPAVTPNPPDGDIYQAFRTGEAKKAVAFAAEAVADSLLALQQHVATWGKRNASP